MINESIVRTSNHYNINGISIDKNLLKLDNTYNDNLNNYNKKVNVKYGLGKEVNDEVNNSNYKREVIIDKDTNIDIKFNDNTITYLLLKVVNDSNTNIIFEGNSYLNTIIKVELNNSVKSNITVTLNNEGTSLLGIETIVNKEATLNFNLANLSSTLTIVNYYSLVDVLGESNLESIYIGKDNDRIDLNYLIDLKGSKSKSKVNVEGLLNDNSYKSFKGTINFIKGSKKAIGSVNENVLVLSENARNISLPMLLCTEEDVEGSHSASSSKIDHKTLLYLMSRGISEVEAKKLIIRSKFDKFLKDEYIKEIIERKLDE